jgi:hypothetical protein
MTDIVIRQLDVISREIKEHEEQSRQAARGAIAHKLSIGERLTVAKGLCPAGTFGDWAAAEFGWSDRHVRRHMELWRHRTRVSALAGLTDASMRAALAAIAPPRQDGERWMLVGELDGEPAAGADPAELREHVTRWKVRKG